MQPGGDAQLRVPGHREHPGGQLLDPVRLPGGQGERGGGQQPAGLIVLAGAEFGGALEGARGGGGAAAPLRLGGRLLEQRGHVLVGFQRGCRQVPGIPVGLLAERAGDLQVGRRAPGERDGVVDSRPGEGVGELWPGSVHPDQARGLGRGERGGGQPGHGRRRHVRAVGDGGQQQRLPCRRGEGAIQGGDDGGEPVGGRQRLGGPAPPGGRVGRDDPGQLDQRHRVAGRLGEHLRPGPAARRVRLGIQQPPGVLDAQRLQPQFREIPLEPRGRDVPARAQQQHERFGFQAPGGEGERVERTAVQPLGVVGDQQQRAVLRQVGEQGEHGEPGQQGIGRHRLRG